MNKLFLVMLVSLSANTFSFGQLKIDPNNIEIVRDEYGVPHIFADTDLEAVYGIAWAECEDNFHLMQENIAVLRGESGKINGKEGAIVDFIAQIFDLDEFVDERYEKDIDPETEALLEAYVQGINAYALAHPSEIIFKDYTPTTVKEILQAYTFSFLLLTTAVYDVARIAGDKMDLYKSLGDILPKGSNGMAFSPNITSDGKSYMVGNPHLPSDGPVRFWELSVHTKEGLDFFGATFVGGGVTPMIGTNRNLGWTHTTNFDDYSDVYELKMHPTEKNKYEYDGDYLELEEKKVKLKVKVGPLVIPVKKKYYKSIHGPVLKNKSGYFAIRCNTFFNIKQIQQWYKMAKSNNYDEFWEALKILGIPSQTVTYADKEHNIMHINYALMPDRSEEYEWRGIVPGNTSKTLWSLDNPLPIEEMVYVKNPKSGYVFNCNNTPFDCTADEENPKPEDYPKSFGMLETNTARAKRFKELISINGKLDFEKIKAIRDDHSYHSTDLNFRQALNMNDVFAIAEKNPEYADVSALLKKWDRKMNIENKQASFVSVLSMYISEILFEEYALYDNYLSEETILDGFKFARKFLKKHYGTMEVELGKVQRLVRGDITMPMYGSPQTLANSHMTKYKDGQLRIVHGDTYIMYAQYGDEGLSSFKTVNIFGNSNKADSPHYTDQMAMFVNRELKDVELDLEKIREKAKRIYHPK